jgi:NADP-dependent 3-hydroxy acid dehydrogenase YdfG
MTDAVDERVALVTGASSGIGAAIARRLASRGVQVAACARRKDRLEALAAELPAGRILPMEVDLRAEAEILSAFEQVQRRFGRLDILVNNAGLGRPAPLTSGATEAWREMLEVNVLALCVCTREAVRLMEAGERAGHVVHVSSMAAHRVPPGSGVYSATKFAVRSLTEGLRKELRERSSPIRVTAVSPGFVETEFHAQALGSEEKAQEIYDRFDKVLEPEDVAAAVEYVVSAPPHVEVHDILMRPTDQTF